MKDPYDYIEEEYVDLDGTDLPSKASNKGSSKNTLQGKHSKVAKTLKSFGNKNDKTTEEGSGEHEVSTLNDDEDSPVPNDELTEGSGTNFKTFTFPITHHDNNEVTKHDNKISSNVKFGEFLFTILYFSR